ISSKSINPFLSNVVHRQTNRQMYGNRQITLVPRSTVTSIIVKKKKPVTSWSLHRVLSNQARSALIRKVTKEALFFTESRES
uniref:Uncharacterized protein n=1 Tax=Acanthochromis polyacanthus TaxID=80966 RepID=A0A3Q1FKK6_9TELE